ncbi:neuronal acetylcholine receptor subunit alpha-4 [Drosophila subpulchrella]|uniref:neuronal acetylcholine receptor subunit alpha-4 n=1 Tax=Drosophila subpulchrella TaxID=1486046 RepID=UPI0018A17890|nr:neuronal acetylcholine receptor subunit alpha-4 [Drosophila subpulchrella]
MTTTPKINPLISGPGLLQMLMGILFMVSASVPGATSDSEPKKGNVKASDRLHAGLFFNYDTDVQPQFQGSPTNVSLGMVINYIDIDELNGKMTTHCWLNIRWRDEQRVWQPSEYENITEITLRASEVWTPQITLFNGDEGGLLADTQVTLTHDGHFRRMPPALYTAYCDLNMLNWPHDKQTCKLKIGSWGLKVILPDNSTGKDKSLDHDDLVQSPEWEIVDSRAEFVSQDYNGYMEYTLVAKRRSSMYTAVIYTPASCIVILALSAFWLPPHMGGEKIMINGLLIIVIAAFLMYFAQLLPVLSNNTPLVVLFYSTTLLFLSVSTIIEVLVLYLATAKHKRRLPEALRKLLHGNLGTWLLLSQFSTTGGAEAEKTKEMDEHLYDNPDEQDATSPLGINPTEAPGSKANQFDWALLATAVDRIFFVVFSLAFLVLAICCAV